MTVEGMDRLRAKFRALPDAIRAAVRDEMEKMATEYVAQMRRLAPKDSGALAASIGWTWGAAPKGTIAIGGVAGPGGDDGFRITIYAGGNGPGGDAFYARWVEFGTRPHSVTKSASLSRGSRQGRKLHPGAPAQPFFWPVIRAGGRNRTRRINTAARKAAQQIWGK